MSAPLNPKNVPTRGNMTYAALVEISGPQLRMLGRLRSIAGDPPMWDDTCRIILGDDWDGVYRTLSQAAGSWLIHSLQAGLVAASQPGDLDVQGAPA